MCAVLVLFLSLTQSLQEIFYAYFHLWQSFKTHLCFTIIINEPFIFSISPKTSDKASLRQQKWGSWRLRLENQEVKMSTTKVIYITLVGFR